MQFGESTKDTIIREIYEETGEQMQKVQSFATVENFFTHRGKQFHELLYVYKGTLRQTDIYSKENMWWLYHNT